MDKIISTDDLEKAKKIIKKTNEKPIIVLAKDEKFNRKIVEYGKFDILLSVEKSDKKDKLKQLDGGLNHVLASIAYKNRIAIGIDMEEIRCLEKKEKAKRIARIRQNIKICRKEKTKIVLLNCKDKIDGFNFLISLGASTAQAKEATSF